MAMDNPPSTESSTVGKRIRKAREAAGLISRDFALAIDVAEGTVSRYENDHITPSSEKLVAISRRLGCSMFWLMTGEEPSTPDLPPASPADAA